MKNAFYIAILYLVLFSCANPVAPTGGTKDLNPPTVRYISPVNAITNFDGKHIEIAFDEYFIFSKSTEKILITPPVNKTPDFKVKGKKLLIEFKDSLEPNTTYTINLFGAISDFHEGNVLDNVSYVFSTGDVIDSSSVEGKTVKAFNNESMGKVVVALFNSADSAILKGSRPSYLAKSNDNGTFVINNIKEGTYRIAAINDKNFNNTFDQLTEDVSLISSEIYIDGNIALKDPLVLFLEEKENAVNTVKLLNNNKLVFCFEKGVEQIIINSSEFNELDKAYFNKEKDSLFYYYHTDSSKIDFYISVDGMPNDTISVSLKKNELKPNIIFDNNCLAWKDSVKIMAPFFIEHVNANNIHLTDSNDLGLNFKYRVDKDQFIVYFPFKETNKYVLSMDSAALKYYDNILSIPFYKEFVKEKPKELSNLILTVSNEMNYQAVAELYSKDKLLQSKDVMGNEMVFEGLQPGQYKIRVYEDLNQNGKWDTGNFKLQIEPEKTLFYSQPIDIKENWDKEININF